MDTRRFQALSARKQFPFNKLIAESALEAARTQVRKSFNVVRFDSDMNCYSRLPRQPVTYQL
jgi:hypothetical protein